MTKQPTPSCNPAVQPLGVFMASLFSFPPVGHSANETFDAAHFAEVVARRRDLPTLPELRFKARGAAVGCRSYCLLADDSIALVDVGPRGGKRIVWNFGLGRA